MKRFRADRGFTLVELLVVVIIGALVLTGVYEFFGAGLAAWRRQRADHETRYHAARALDEIAQALTAAYVGGTITDFIGIDGVDPETESDRDAVEFVTADGRLPAPDGYDLSRVGYFIDGLGESGLVKIVDPHPFAHPIAADTVPDPGAVLPMFGAVEYTDPTVVSLRIQYFDGSGWVEAWDSRVDGILPLAVAVAVGVKDPGGGTVRYEKVVSVAGGRPAVRGQTPEEGSV
ncbi:MAG: prepilin-type N-terminal cleavage/methylation domain-containing protein [Bacteroidota bacterium]